MATATRLLGNTPAAPGALSVLLLADGRFPAGGHAHSAGIEAAVSDGRVHDVVTLEEYVRGRLWTAGLTDAALAEATVTRLRAAAGAGTSAVLTALAALDDEADARAVAPPVRAASRRLGAQLVRAAERCWPGAVLAAVRSVHPAGAHQAVAYGGVAVAAGAGTGDAAMLVVHHAMTTPAQAAVRLLGLDPFEATAVVARLSGEATAVVADAMAAAVGPLEGLPCPTGTLVDIAAMHHAASERRLFAT